MNQRNGELKQLYLRVFKGQEDYIPFIITLPCPNAPTLEDYWHDLPAAVLKAAELFKPRLQIGSDWIPTIAAGMYHCISVPSLFGAEVVKLDGSDPLIHPCFKTIDEALEAGTPPVKGEIIDRMIKDVRAAHKSITQQGYKFCFPATASPFDLAQLMLGEEFLLSLVLRPDKAQTFLVNLSKLAIEIINIVKAEMNEPKNEYNAGKGYFFPGFRLPSDAIVNYSPSILRNVLPGILKIFGQEYENLCVHYCTEPAPSQHILPALLESEYVIAVDNHHGPDVFIGENTPAPFQDKITIASTTDLTTPEKMDQLLAKEALRKVKRKGGRGFIVFTEAESVDHGKKLYQQWHRRMAKLH